MNPQPTPEEIERHRQQLWADYYARNSRPPQTTSGTIMTVFFVMFLMAIALVLVVGLTGGFR